ncbi:hypothetical protein EUTSA_v10003332mg, partial [Eutrema salsugineum]
CIIRHTQSDIDELLLSSRFQETIHKVKHIFEDKTRLAAYAQVDYFCSFILQNFSQLKRQSDVHLLPEETKVAMAGLIFAASRIGELKELQYIRSLFFERFGPEFDKDSAYLRPGNFVTTEIIQIFSTMMPQDAISPKIGMETSQKYQPNITTTVESITEDSDSSNNLGFRYSDAVKIEILTTGVSRANAMKEFLHLNRVESQVRDRSLFMR